MAINSLSEGFARITYTGSVRVHHMVVPINFSGTPTAGDEPDLTTKDASTIGAVAGITNFVNEISVIFADETLFGLCEIYAVDADDDERHFIYAFDLGLAGIGAGEQQPYKMITMTFKTRIGGISKLVFMEHRQAGVFKLRTPYAPGNDYDLIAAYMLSDACIVIGRDNNYPFAPISASNRYSDALLQVQ